MGQLLHSNNWIPLEPQVKIEDIMGEKEKP
jgi:hypothetical protein